MSWIVVARFETRGIYFALAYVGLGLALVSNAGFVLAAWNQRRSAIVAGTVALIALGVTYVAPALVGAQWNALSSIASIARTLALLWLAHLALPADAVPSIALAVRGLRWIARALWLRLAAAIGLALLSVGAIGGKALATFRMALVGEIGIELIVFAVVSIGALSVARAALPEASRRSFVVGGLASMWCAGVMIVKAPVIYTVIGGTVDFGDSMSYVDRLSIGEPLVAVAAIALVALALRGIPALAALADLAASRAIAFVCLMLASIGLASFGVEHATSLGNAIGMMLFGAGASLVATALVAGLFGRAADALEREQPNLPTATVV